MVDLRGKHSAQLWPRLSLGAAAALVLALSSTAPAAASGGANVTGGGTTSGMTRFTLAIHNGKGHFECLMPGLMTVEATVTSATAGGGTASFAGVARVTLAKGNPFGLPAGILATNAAFSGSAVAGGPGTGSEDLKVLGMDFPGTIEHGQIRIQP